MVIGYRLLNKKVRKVFFRIFCCGVEFKCYLVRIGVGGESFFCISFCVLKSFCIFAPKNDIDTQTKML